MRNLFILLFFLIFKLPKQLQKFSNNSSQIIITNNKQTWTAYAFYWRLLFATVLAASISRRTILSFIGRATRGTPTLGSAWPAIRWTMSNGSLSERRWPSGIEVGSIVARALCTGVTPVAPTTATCFRSTRKVCLQSFLWALFKIWHILFVERWLEWGTRSLWKLLQRK